MNIVKELKDISLHITEPEYRQRPELSYSTLSRYESLGFNGLDHLFDKLDTPSLTFGGCVDCLLTDGMDAFNDLYIVMDINISDSGLEICKKLHSLYGECHHTFYEIPEYIVSQVAKELGFWQADKWDARRYKEVLKTGNVVDYYNALSNSSKRIIDTQTYNDALACVRALKTSPATQGFFADDDEMSPVRRYYQLKFAAMFGGIGYRTMMDEVIVDYEDKRIIPIDLKTCSCPEWDFMSNFVKFHYFIQARLYWRVLKANLMNDPYFKDFELEDFRFVVINRRTLTPLVWEFPLTQSKGTLIDKYGNEHRDPFEIGKELQGYLNLRPRVPNGIDIDGVNTIDCLKLKEDITA